MWWRGTSTSPDHCSLSRDTGWANFSLRFMSLVRDAYPLVACNRLSQDMSREIGLFVDGLNQALEPGVERLRVRPFAENRTSSLSASIQRNPVKRSIRCSSTYSSDTQQSWPFSRSAACRKTPWNIRPSSPPRVPLGGILLATRPRRGGSARRHPSLRKGAALTESGRSRSRTLAEEHAAEPTRRVETKADIAKVEVGMEALRHETKAAIETLPRPRKGIRFCAVERHGCAG